jgi:tetratricopeptide (TPR) repeat protein
MKQLPKIALFLFLAVALSGMVESAFGQLRNRQPARPATPAQGSNQQPSANQRQTPARPQPSLTPAFVRKQNGSATLVLIADAGRFPNAPALGGLSGCDFDAAGLARGFERAEIPAANIVSQCKVPLLGWTKENVNSELDRFAGAARRNDTLIVVLIGKTVQKGDLHYFCTADTSDAALTDTGNETGLIELTDFANRIAKSPATHKTLILDIVGKEGFPDMSGWSPPSGLWVIASASAKETPMRESRLVPNSRETRSVFCYYLAQGLFGPADMIGNNDGEISLFELSEYAANNTRAYAERAERIQNPRLTKSSQNVQQVATQPPTAGRGVQPQPRPQQNATSAVNFTVGRSDGRGLRIDPYAIDEYSVRLTTADRSASAGNRVVQSLYLDLRKSFADAEKRYLDDPKNTIDVTDAMKRQQRGAAFVNSNFLDPVLAADPKHKTALLARASIYRGHGNYESALKDYQAAEELFELFITDAKPKVEQEDVSDFSNVSDSARSGTSRSGNDLTVEAVPIYRSFSKSSGSVTTLNRGEKIFVQEVKFGESNYADDEWIKIRAYPEHSTPVEGWVHRDYVFWSPEAADWYTPIDKLGRMYRDKAEQLERAARALEIKARRAARAAVGLAIAAQIVGGDVGRGTTGRCCRYGGAGADTR